MLPGDMNLKIKTGTVGYNSNFSPGKNDEVNSLETPAIKSHRDSNVVKQTAPAGSLDITNVTMIVWIIRKMTLSWDFPFQITTLFSDTR